MQTDQFPLVSILVPTYNHASFIKECFNGISSQICGFDFEVVVCDDASTDQTVQLIKEFGQNKSLPINGIYRDVNIGMNANILDGLQKCTGRYIAICEGDDYWTDPKKLQKQVDFMEENPDFSICFHPVQIIDYTTGEMPVTNMNTPEVSNLKDLAKGNFIHTASALLKNFAFDYPEWMRSTTTPDYGIFMLNAVRGPIKKLPDVMAVYRKHDTGIWSQLKDLEMREKIVFYLRLMKDEFDPEINRTLQQRLDIILISLAREYAKEPETSEKSVYYAKILESENPSLHKEFTTEMSNKKRGHLLDFKRLKRNKKS